MYLHYTVLTSEILVRNMIMNEIQSRLDFLNQKLRETQAEVESKSIALERATHRYELACESASEVLYERDCAIIESWAGEPDWNVLLTNSDDYSSAMYEYGNAMLNQHHLRASCTDGDTNQRNLIIHFETNSPHELANKVKGVEFIMDYIKVGKHGDKTISISHGQSCDFALEFGFNPKTNETYIVKSTFGCRDSKLNFADLQAALSYVQSTISDTDLVQQTECLAG